MKFVAHKTKTKKNQNDQNYWNEAMAEKQDRQECIC